MKNKPDFNKLNPGKKPLDIEAAVKAIHDQPAATVADEKKKEKSVRISVDVSESTHDALKMHLIKNKQFNKLGPFLAYLAQRELGLSK
jgi:hypothetical protein